jgi:predicted ArsR family transcriptional regulator
VELTEEMRLQAKAIADKTRFRIFEHIIDAARPVGIAELTEMLGFSHNAVRQHLAILIEAGLLAESTETRTIRGRPRKEYEPRADALDAFGSVSGSYVKLAELLLIVATSDLPPYVIGARSSSNVSLEPAAGLEGVVELLGAQLSRDGFEPRRATGFTTILGNCPYADVAAKNPEIVCELHRGLIDGYLSAQDPPITHDLVVKPPMNAGCEVQLRVSLVDQASA